MKKTIILLLLLSVSATAGNDWIQHEAEDFINTFYTTKSYEGDKYPKHIEVLFHDEENEEALLFTKYELPTFDDEGYFKKTLKVENYVLMRTDGERRYNIYCLCPADETINNLSVSKYGYKNYGALMEALQKHILENE